MPDKEMTRILSKWVIVLGILSFLLAIFQLPSLFYSQWVGLGVIIILCSVGLGLLICGTLFLIHSSNMP
ncbi:MAG: hypothetical protein ACFFC7_25765 [Candidatus Hermodarchaeota archaeon]